MTGRKRLLAVSSAGGHWAQLMLLRDAFSGHAVTYATTLAGAGDGKGLGAVALIPDCNRHTPGSMVRLAISAIALMARLRPDTVVSTGALPGLAFIVLGRLTGARTIWVESIANSEEMSLSGRWASRIAHHCLVQWPQLAVAGRTRHAGSVL